MITSSNINNAPALSQARRKPSRKPGTGATTPILAATGSTMTAATVSSISGITLYGATMVLATASGGTPAVPGIPSVATPLPPAARRASVAPWKLPLKIIIFARPVSPRASRTTVEVASVPEFIKRTRSHDGTRSLIASANFISRGVGAPKEVPSTAASRRAAVIAGCAWPRMTAP